MTSFQDFLPSLCFLFLFYITKVVAFECNAIWMQPPLNVSFVKCDPHPSRHCSKSDHYTLSIIRINISTQNTFIFSFSCKHTLTHIIYVFVFYLYMCMGIQVTQGITNLTHDCLPCKMKRHVNPTNSFQRNYEIMLKLC